MSQALRVKLALEAVPKRIEALYEVICDGKNLCDDEFNDTLDNSFLKFREQANATKEPSQLQLLQSKYLIECARFFESCAARKGARKPDPRRVTAACSASGGKAVQMANRQNPPRQQFPVF